MSSDKDHLEVILEDMNGKFDRLIEVAAQMQDTLERTATKDELAEVKADIKVIKAAVVDHSGQLNDHEQRITHLESA